LPHAEKQDDRANRSHGGENVDEPWTVKVRDEKLQCGKRRAGDENCGPDSKHPAAARICPDQPERDNHREERQLAADHRAQLEEIEIGHALQRDDRRAERAISDRGRVGDEREARRVQRREAQADQQRTSDCDGSAKA